MKLFAIVGLTAAFLRLMGGPVYGHDQWGSIREGNEPTGMLCCGGDPVTGDCENLGPNYEMQPDGSVIFMSKRYGRPVHVGKPKISWQQVPGYEWSEANWCGKPREKLGNSNLPVFDEQPDTDFWTYCAFIAPGGV